jgi:hypothetical protein
VKTEDAQSATRVVDGSDSMPLTHACRHASGERRAASGERRAASGERRAASGEREDANVVGMASAVR